MRAIIIDEKDSSNLLDLLKLEKFTHEPCGYSKTRDLMADRGLTKEEMGWVIEDIHKRFHYIVCRWLQEQGASCVR